MTDRTPDYANFSDQICPAIDESAYNVLGCHLVEGHKGLHYDRYEEKWFA